MADNSTATLYEKVKWVFLVIAKLWKQKFCGTLLLEFHNGDLCHKYRTQETHYAPGSEKHREQTAGAVQV